ncbi:MAG: hypothetical protein NT084_07000 [Bacteroidetes bacterium]|nr:hypothetical protein [Bacteroidota bacterium]
MSRFALSGILLLVIFSVALTSGCAKDKPCKAVVTVLDPSGNPLSGADVHLKVLNSTPPSATDLQTSTDASGQASYEVNLPQILDIVVTGFPATGKVVRFEQGKTDAVTVQL